jgi:hypothetical protein
MNFIPTFRFSSNTRLSCTIGTKVLKSSRLFQELIPKSKFQVKKNFIS